MIVAAASVPLVLAGGAALISVLIVQSCSDGTGLADSASQVAQRDIPANFLAIYESVGARYRIPWEVLAGIGEEECDHGRNPDPSCTPQPGATGPGIVNCAGASGPMQIGVGGGSCGSAGDQYHSLRQFLPDPSLGPHDPTTAVELAALVLIKDKGSPTGQTIDAYLPYVQAYNGSGLMAAAYSARVLADAHAYQGVGTAVLAGCVAVAAGAYVNPFVGEDWAASRNDQGVDYDPLKAEPIRAIGAGTIVDIGSWGSYGPWFDYRLAAGQFAGKCIYVAEHIDTILPPGTSFNAGDTLATAYPGPDWTEWGWAKGRDTPTVTWAECGCTEQDNVNPGGRAFARFLRSLGATTEQGPGAGADVCGRVVLSHRRRRAASRTRSGRRNGVVAWRVAVTFLAAAVIVAAESAAVLSASGGHRPNGHRDRPRRADPVVMAYNGEPNLPSPSRRTAGPWTAAVRFVRDYARWSDGHLAAVPAEDATPRVIRLLGRRVKAIGVGPEPAPSRFGSRLPARTHMW